MELQFIGFQFEVGARFRSHFNEGRQIALEAGQLEVRDLEDVVADVVEETCVDGVTKPPRLAPATRRLSDGHVDGVTATWDAIFPSSS